MAEVQVRTPLQCRSKQPQANRDTGWHGKGRKDDGECCRNNRVSYCVMPHSTATRPPSQAARSPWNALGLCHVLARNCVPNPPLRRVCPAAVTQVSAPLPLCLGIFRASAETIFPTHQRHCGSDSLALAQRIGQGAPAGIPALVHSQCCGVSRMSVSVCGVSLLISHNVITDLHASQPVQWYSGTWARQKLHCGWLQQSR